MKIESINISGHYYPHPHPPSKGEGMRINTNLSWEWGVGMTEIMPNLGVTTSLVNRDASSDEAGNLDQYL